MTFRAKPVGNRPHRPSRDGESRRNFYLNVGFGLAIAAAVLILVGVAVVTWYNEHLAAAASVDGQTITKDDFSERASVELWRLQQRVDRVNAALAAGRLTSAQPQIAAPVDPAARPSDSLAPLVIERLIDIADPGPARDRGGITITPEQIDAQLLEEATTPEQRHAWIIEVEPELDADATEPTAEQKAAAKAIADQALADVTSGAKTWEDVAKAVSTDSSKTSGGDLGWINATAAEDEAFLDAIFAAELNKPTAVIEGEDGDLPDRTGDGDRPRDRSIDAWEQKLAEAEIRLETYREVLESDVIREASRTRSSPPRRRRRSSVTSARSRSRPRRRRRPTRRSRSATSSTRRTTTRRRPPTVAGGRPRLDRRQAGGRGGPRDR